MITTKTYSGNEAEKYIQAVAQLRITVFLEFPYLYDGTMEYEEKYLKILFQSPDNVIVIALDGEKVIGASTGLPLVDAGAEIAKSWTDSHDISKVFYFSESVLLKEYRGKGIGLRFFEERENWVKRLGRFEKMVFCGVVRSVNHHRKPANYLPLDNFWKKQGFMKTENTVCEISWQDLDETAESPKMLHFWYKDL
jgi:GNAT superfamily N-acetyltransferase